MPSADLILAVYDNLDRPPRTDDERRACAYGVSDSCRPPCVFPFAYLDKVRVPPRGAVLVYSARYNASGATPDDRYQLHVRTDELVPASADAGVDASRDGSP